MITKEQFYSLFSPTITKQEYDAIIQKIEERFVEICEKFLTKTNKTAWFDFDNMLWGTGGTGHLDPYLYKEYIPIKGNYIQFPPSYYNGRIPTRWLWESGWEKEMQKVGRLYKKEVKRQEEKAKQQRMARKQKMQALQASIKKKLTKEELKAITFKKP